MEGKDLRKIRGKLGLSIKEMSELLDTPYRTYQDWELGNRRIPGICQVAIRCLMTCKKALKIMRKKEKKKYPKEVYVMGREVILFETEERKNAAEVATFLRTLADKIEAGSVTLKAGAKELVLTMPKNLVFEVKVEEEEKKGKTKRSLEVEIEWYLGEISGADEGVEIA